jgi:hypothetical protein
LLTLRRLLGAAALLVGAVVPLSLAASPAHAAACTSGGVTVVVDYGSLHSGVDEACVAGGGGKKAADLFEAAHEPLTYVTSQAGAVCRVAGQPSSATCSDMPPADAYWGLFWSDGASGSWTYAPLGVNS